MGRNSTGVRKASQSSIEITFTYKGRRCRERIALKPTSTNLKRAANHRGAVLDAIDKDTFDYAATFPDSPRAQQFSARPGSLEDYFQSWLKEKKTQLKNSTWRDYDKTANLLTESLGDLDLTEINRPRIKDFCVTRKCSNKRLANILSVLRVALQDAVDDELIVVNPLYGWSYKRKEAPRSVNDVDPFSIDEQDAILNALPDQGRNLIQFALWTGMRTSELVALEWGDIDWQRNVIVVTRAITQASTEAETTKTDSGNREVKLLPPALSALKAQKTHSLLHPSGRVFLNPRTEKPWTGDQAIRKTLWIHALKKAGVRYRRPYQTRHTFASMMLSASEHPAWIAKQMGHSDLKMIFKVYAKWMPDANPDAGMAAVKMFSGGANASILPALASK